MRSDFYLAAAAVIPVLALVLFVDSGRRRDRRVTFLVATEKEVSRLNWASRLGPIVGSLLYAVIVTWGEFACLRSLELGRDAAGGTLIVWAALGLLAVAIVIGFVLVTVYDVLVPEDSAREVDLRRQGQPPTVSP